MKIYKFTTIIEADDYLTKKDILDQIDRDVNRGMGIYVCVGVGSEKEYKKKEISLKFLKKVKDKR